MLWVVSWGTRRGREPAPCCASLSPRVSHLPISARPPKFCFFPSERPQILVKNFDFD